MRGNVRPVLMDALLAAVLVGLAVASVTRRSEGAPGWPALLLAVLMAAPIALRQRAPVITTCVVVGAMATYDLMDYTQAELPTGGMGMLIGMFTVATLRPRHVAALVFAPALAVMTVYIMGSAGTDWSHVAQSTLVLLGAWILGEGTRRWAQRTEQLAARAAQAVAEERVRIARELHDVVAHHMSVVSLQVGVAQYVLDTDRPTARNAIAAAGDSSREALTEMRRLLDVLRVDDATDPDYRPQPGLAELDALVERTRSAGVPVEVVVTGPVRPLAPGPDLCAYRVVQESLTNVLKHAGPATAHVTVEYGERSLTLTVRDDGVGSRPRDDSAPASHGIRGMRERAELYGGVLTAGPLPGRGFAVVLRLPISEDR